MPWQTYISNQTSGDLNVTVPVSAASTAGGCAQLLNPSIGSQVIMQIWKLCLRKYLAQMWN